MLLLNESRLRDEVLYMRRLKRRCKVVDLAALIQTAPASLTTQSEPPGVSWPWSLISHSRLRSPDLV